MLQTSTKRRRARRKGDRLGAELSPQPGLWAEMECKNKAASREAKGHEKRGKTKSCLAADRTLAGSLFFIWECGQARPPRLPRNREEVVLIELCLHSVSDSEDNTFGGRGGQLNGQQRAQAGLGR